MLFELPEASPYFSPDCTPDLSPDSALTFAWTSWYCVQAELADWAEALVASNQPLLQPLLQFCLYPCLEL